MTARSMKGIFLVASLCVTSRLAFGQTFTSLESFNGLDGEYPGVWLSLVQGLDGNFYGTTLGGGNFKGYYCSIGCGTVFRITPAGSITILHRFCEYKNCTDGFGPESGLVQAPDGSFYGMTENGGNTVVCNDGCGTIFRITPQGAFTTVHVFERTDGANPTGPLVRGSDGNFYGTTPGGGENREGTVFKLTPSAALTTLYSFSCVLEICSDGAEPFAGLVEGSDGSFYGTTFLGGVGGRGLIFKITAEGVYSVLHSFQANEPTGDLSQLVQGTDGDFYGTTYGGSGQPGFCGTVFKVTPNGTLIALHEFADKGDGGFPEGGLILGTDGNFYGTTTAGGAGGNQNGTIFEITPQGTLTTLYTFEGVRGYNPDGAFPMGTLVQGTDGSFYGTTYYGGTHPCYGYCGTVFNLSMGLGPFVETLPAAGGVGASVVILGTDLTGASSVAFNGTASSFTLVSGSEITTQVPTGATTGTVEVTTPSGILHSNVAFEVR